MFRVTGEQKTKGFTKDIIYNGRAKKRRESSFKGQRWGRGVGKTFEKHPPRNSFSHLAYYDGLEEGAKGTGEK